MGIRIRESFVQDIFALTDKQMDRMIIRTETRPGPLYRETASIFGEELEEMRTVWAYDQKIYALRNGDGIVYVPESAILAACKPEDYISYRLARDERGRLLVAIIRDAPPPTRSGSAAARGWNPKDSPRLVAPAEGSGATAYGMFCEALLSPVRDDIADDISEKLRKVGGMPILRTTISKEEDADEVAEN